MVYDPLRVDIWALGVLLYYIYEGCYPFRGYNEKDLARNISGCCYPFNRCEGWPRKAIESCLVNQASARTSVEGLLEMLRK